MGGVDLVGVVAVICIFGLPMLGLVTRFALRPLVQDITAAIRAGSEEEMKDLRERLAALESRMEAQEEELDRLSEAERFHRELRSGEGGGG